MTTETKNPNHVLQLLKLALLSSWSAEHFPDDSNQNAFDIFTAFFFFQCNNCDVKVKSP